MDSLVWITLLCVSFISSSFAQTFYVAAPNSFRLGSDETVAIAVDGTNSAQMVEVFIQDHPGKIKNISKTVFPVHPGKPEIFKIQLKPEDLPGTVLTDPTVRLFVKLIVHSGAFKKETVIPLSTKTGNVFIQTDKPIYTPDQRANFRIIPLNQDALPSNNEFQLQIRNPQNVIVEETSFNKNSQKSKKSFLSHIYKFPTYPLLGDWTATVRFGYQLQQNTTVRFELQEYVLPTFSVDLKTREVILPSDEIITASVEAKYVYGKNVQGTATLRLGVKGEAAEVLYFSVVGPAELEDGSHNFIMNTSILKRHKDIGWFPEIEGSHFVVEATVMDAASGNKEVAKDTKTQFSTSPFVISFKRCLGDFKPGLVSIIEADVNYVDGRPAAGISTAISGTANGNLALKITKSTAVSSQEGKISFEIQPEIHHTEVSITVKTTDQRYAGSQATGHHVQRKFISKNKGYIAIARNSGKTLKPQEMFVESIYIEPTEISDIYYMIVSKGKILQLDKLPHGNFKMQRVEFMVTYAMVPSFRLVVFAHHKGELIADSLKVDVEERCDPKAEVTIDPAFLVKEPGNNGKIVIRGTKSTLVGLLAVDEAVYALSKRDLLTKSKMFKTIDRHDMGCGPGGGLTTDSVLANAGVVIFTSNYSPTNQQSVSSCEEKVRRKRNAISEKLSEYSDLEEKLEKQCCALGISKDDRGRDCQQRTNILNRYFKGEHQNCSRAFLECCLHAKETGVTDMKLMRQGPILQTGRVSNKRLEEPTFVTSEEEDFFENQLTVRKDFRETWIFDDVIVGPDGREELEVSLPHSITTWVIQAVSVSPVHGMCVAPVQKLVSFKKVFLQLNLPYSVVRNEQVEIQATVFNYDQKKLAAIVYMYGVKDLCTGTQEEERSERKRIFVEPQSAQSVTFPVIPLKDGSFDIKVVVLTPDGSDIIQRRLNVIPEGYPVEVDIPLKLDPSNQQRRNKRHITTDKYSDSIDESQKLQVTAIKLSAPEGFIPGTESCTITALGDEFGPTVQTAIQDPDKLLLKPRGCGEQNMMFLAPTLYTMKYLKVNGKITPENEEKGYSFIRHGYGNQLSFRKEDGSYGAYITTPSSTWLTAFVVKIFCQANNLVHIDENVMCSGVKWLLARQQNDGSFIESHPVYHRDMMGGVQGSTPMTAFTLIALEECKCDAENLRVTKARAVAYLEEHLGDVKEPLPVAIVAYALALSDSELKGAANGKLLSLSKYNEDTNMLHWGTGSDAKDVETTSYGLLTQLLFNDMQKGNSIVNWLNTKRLSSGSFPSTQDTVMALQALSEYAIRAQAPGINLVANITSSNDRNFHKVLEFHESNALVLQDVKVDKIGGMLFVNTAGHGVGLLSVKLRYNLPYPPEKQCKFDVNIEVTEEKEKRVIGVAPNLDPNGKDVFDPLPDDLIRGAKKALAEDAPRLDVDPRNRRQPPSLVANLRPKRIQAKHARVKRQNRPENSNLVLKINICTKYLGDHEAGMSIIDAGIFSGFVANTDDLEKLQKSSDDLIQRYEISSRGVVFYLEKVPNTETYCFTFRVTRSFIVGNTQTSVVKVYDYYNPDESCTAFYSPGSNSPMLHKICSNGICQCAEGGCPAKEPFAHISSLEQKELRARLNLIACEQNDYVWIGRITGQLKREGGFLNIKFNIDEVIKQGTENSDQLVGETRLLLARDNCESAELFPDSVYLIMGKDGQKYKNEKGELWYRYILDKTSSIHLWTDIRQAKDKSLQRALNAVTKTLKQTGCDQ